jgi:hypothetical protein
VKKDTKISVQENAKYTKSYGHNGPNFLTVGRTNPTIAE